LVNTITMAIPTTDVSFNAINTELGYSSTATLSINDSNFTGMIGVAPDTAVDLNTSKGKTIRWVAALDPGSGSNYIWTISSGAPTTSKVGIYSYVTHASLSATTIDGKLPVFINKIGRSGNLIEQTLLGFPQTGGSLGTLSMARGIYFENFSGNFYLATWQAGSNCWDINKISGGFENPTIWGVRLPAAITGLNVNSIISDDTGNVYISLQNWQAGTPTRGRIVKLSSTGVFLWATGQSDIGTLNQGTTLMPDRMMLSVDQNSVYGVGTHNPTSSVRPSPMVCKFNSDGSNQWVRQSGGEGSILGSFRDSSENIYIAYRLTGYGSTTDKFFIIVFNSSGNWVWEKSYQSASNTNDYLRVDQVSALHYDGSNIYVATGINTQGFLANQYGYGPNASTGRLGISITKLTLSGAVVWQRFLYSDVSGVGVFSMGETAFTSDGLSNLLITGYVYNAGIGYSGTTNQVLFSLPKDGSGTGYAINSLLLGGYTHTFSYAVNSNTINVVNGASEGQPSGFGAWANAQYVYTVRSVANGDTTLVNTSASTVVAGSSLSSQPSVSYRKSNL
jgi:hypothetical protein